MILTSTRYDFGSCSVEHVDRTSDGIVIRMSQAEHGEDEVIFTLSRVEIADLCERASDLLMPEVLIQAQLEGQEFCTA